jgi:DMSO/TMAO reductase YedYZ molybdopterin-dependent catalytic subunit
MAAEAADLEPPPRLVDGAILALVGFEVLSGLASLLVGTPDDGWLFVLHGIAGLSLVVLLFWKLRRVRHRVLRAAARDRATPVSVLLAVVALATLATGVAWSFLGVIRVGGFTLLFGHMLLGVLVVPVLAWHLRHRLRLPRRRDVEGRRSALQFGAVLVGAAAVWRSKELLAGLAGLAGADRRFTGSKSAAGTGNDFPVTSWVADDPDPIDRENWRLDVRGEVETPAAFSYDGVAGAAESGSVDAGDGDSTVEAVLDCTSGWYAERRWRGIPLAALLEAVDPTDDAAWVRVRSVTGYRWSFPIEEAGELLLATHVDGEALTHGHGAPARLVAPGRRGFQWVKWVERIEVTRTEDRSQWVAIFVSGFDG